MSAKDDFFTCTRLISPRKNDDSEFNNLVAAKNPKKIHPKILMLTQLSTWNRKISKKKLN